MAGSNSSAADPVDRGGGDDGDDDTPPMLDLLQMFPDLGVDEKQLYDLSAAAGSSTSGAGGSDACGPRAPAPLVARETDGSSPAEATTTAAAQGDQPPSVLLGPLHEHLPDLFHMEVLRRLGATDLASLAGAGRGFAAAVASTALMQWAKHANVAAPGPYFGLRLLPL